MPAWLRNHAWEMRSLAEAIDALWAHVAMAPTMIREGECTRAEALRELSDLAAQIRDAAADLQRVTYAASTKGES